MRLLLEHGISATVRAGKALSALWAPETFSFLSPPGLPRDSRRARSLDGSGLAWPFPPAPGQEAAGPTASQNKSNIFSLNLVEKLQRLRLDKVVARGEASFKGGGETKRPAGPPVPAQP